MEVSKVVTEHGASAAVVAIVLVSLLARRASNSAKERATLSSSARHSTHKSFLFAANLTVRKLYSHLRTHLRTIPYLQHPLSRRRCPSRRIPSRKPRLYPPTLHLVSTSTARGVLGRPRDEPSEDVAADSAVVIIPAGRVRNDTHPIGSS